MTCEVKIENIPCHFNRPLSHNYDVTFIVASHLLLTETHRISHNQCEKPDEHMMNIKNTFIFVDLLETHASQKD